MTMQKQTPETQSNISLVQDEQEAGLHLDGELNIADYVQDVPSSPKTIDDVHQWVKTKREAARAKLAMRLSTLFAVTLASTCVFAGFAAFSKDADRAFIKDIIPLLITPQVTLLGVALTFYYTSKDED